MKLRELVCHRCRFSDPTFEQPFEDGLRHGLLVAISLIKEIEKDHCYGFDVIPKIREMLANEIDLPDIGQD